MFIKLFTFLISLFSLALVAHAAPGDLDSTFGVNGISRMTNWADTYVDAAVLPDSKIMVLANDWGQNVVLARYNENGTLDNSFDGDGVVIFYPGSQSLVYKMGIQPDGKIVVAGTFRRPSNDDVLVLRFNPNGTLDDSFNGDGKVILNLSNGNDRAFDMKLQSDGKIVVAGSTGATNTDDVFITRLNIDGSSDNTFGTNGVVTTGVTGGHEEGKRLEIQPDGKIVVAGTTTNFSPSSGANLFLARFNKNGSVDNSFGEQGIKKHNFGNEYQTFTESLILQRDGKILVGATLQFYGNSAVFRFLPNGNLDNSFGNNGRVTLLSNSSQINDLILQPDNKIIAAGQGKFVTENFLDIYVTRLNQDGTTDLSFGKDGWAFTPVGVRTTSDYCRSAVLQPDGKILVVGDYTVTISNPNAFILRFDNDTFARPKSIFDFDGDGKSDISVFRPSTGSWYLLQSSSNSFFGQGFGLAADVITPADFDDDGKTDIAVFRPENKAWYIQGSTSGFTAVSFGQIGDIPVPADYDGDGRSDIAVFRPSTGGWYRLNSSNGEFVAVGFGTAEDKPVIGDFDGDGRADIAVYRDSAASWYRLNSSDGQFVAVPFGGRGYEPTPADFDGDGKTDIAVFRTMTSVWYRINSSDGEIVQVGFGSPKDKPVPADYDGDGKVDIAVFRPSEGNWYLLRSTAGFIAVQFGVGEDKPVPSAFVNNLNNSDLIN